MESQMEFEKKTMINNVIMLVIYANDAHFLLESNTVMRYDYDVRWEIVSQMLTMCNGYVFYAAQDTR